MRIGDMFKDFRDHFGLSQADMANLLGASQGIVAKVEIHKALPGFRIFMKFIRLAKKMKYEKLDLFKLEE